MRHVIMAAAALAAATLWGGVEAQAFPAPASPAAFVEAPAGLMLVREGCGPGAHRGAYGRCVLNRGPRGAIRGLLGVPPRRLCPPGTHRAGGVCRRNFRRY